MSLDLTPVILNGQLGSRVYEYLLDNITNGTLKPGTHLPINEISELLGVSSTPVRESLERLRSNGLVKRIPYQGFTVKEFSSEEIRNIYETRAALECYGVRLACKRINEHQKERLSEIQQAGRKLLKESDFEGYAKYNRELHDYILGLAGNSVLQEIVNVIGLRVAVLATQTVWIVGRPQRAIEEHEQIVHAILAGDEYTAADVLERHILDAMQEMIS